MLAILDTVDRVVAAVSDHTHTALTSHSSPQLSVDSLQSGLTDSLIRNIAPVSSSPHQVLSIQQTITKLVTDQSAQTVVSPA